VLKSPRLAHQPVDDVTVVHAVLLPSAQPRHLGHLLLPVSETAVVKNRPRATWTPERRAKTIASMEKLRAAKKRAKKKSAK
jgi:hypothetical protein